MARPEGMVTETGGMVTETGGMVTETGGMVTGTGVLLKKGELSVAQSILHNKIFKSLHPISFFRENPSKPAPNVLPLLGGRGV